MKNTQIVGFYNQSRRMLRIYMVVGSVIFTGCGGEKDVPNSDTDTNLQASVLALNARTGEMRPFLPGKRPSTWLSCAGGKCIDDLKCEEVGPRLCYRLMDCTAIPAQETVPENPGPGSPNDTAENRVAASVPTNYSWYVEGQVLTCISKPSDNVSPPNPGPGPRPSPFNCDDSEYHTGEEILGDIFPISSRIVTNTDTSDNAAEATTTEFALEVKGVDIADIAPVSEKCGPDGIPTFGNCGELIGCHVPGNPGPPPLPGNNRPEPLPMPPVDFEPGHVDKPDYPVSADRFKCDGDTRDPIGNSEAFKAICKPIQDEYKDAVAAAKSCTLQSEDDAGNHKKDPCMQIENRVQGQLGGCHDYWGEFVGQLTPKIDIADDKSLIHDWVCSGCAAYNAKTMREMACTDSYHMTPEKEQMSCKTPSGTVVGECHIKPLFPETNPGPGDSK